MFCFIQKDRKIDVLRKHIAMKREQERLKLESESVGREESNYNGVCRYYTRSLKYILQVCNDSGLKLYWF